ncbi:MAG: hypothetical protein U1F33_11835 [Alphaproteobacteria bacterium]
MKRALLAFVLFLAAASVPLTANAMSVRKFQELDAAAAGKPEASGYDMYLRGLYEAITAFNADAERRQGHALYCMPRSVNVAPVNLREMIRTRSARLKRSLSSGEFEALLDSDLALFLLDGFREGFPCG